MAQVRLNKLIASAQSLAFFILFPLFLGSCNKPLFEKDLSKILGIDKVELERKDQLEEYAGGRGDGYYIEIYELSDNTIDIFKKITNKKLPDKADATWNKFEWRNAPIDSSYKEVLSIVVDYQATEKKINTYINEIKKVIESKETYYSFYYKPNKDNPNHVQFFILDVQGKRLYAIDSKV